MIAHPILNALDSEVFTEIFVSTDSQDVATIAKRFGAKIPFIRSANLSDDLTPTVPVIQDAILRIQEIQPNDYVCCVYPTSVFLEPKVFVESKKQLRLLREGQFLVSVTSFDYPIQRALVRSEQNDLNFLNPEFSQTRSQDLSEAFHDAAQFYWATAESWLNSENIFLNARGMYLDRNDIQDIDTLEDFNRAELIFKFRGK
jgi:pseudaminic acid cytidylyltransferase